MAHKDNAHAPSRDVGQTHPRGDQPVFDTPPETTNYQHPGKAGRMEAVPGAGVLHGGADAGPVVSGPPELLDALHPGGGADACTPAAAPGAMRAGTTTSGVKSVPAHGGINAPAPGGRATEASPTSASGTAPFDRMTGPDDTGMPEGASETLAPEIHDPNFSAANRGFERKPTEAEMEATKDIPDQNA